MFRTGRNTPFSTVLPFLVFPDNRTSSCFHNIPQYYFNIFRQHIHLKQVEKRISPYIGECLFMKLSRKYNNLKSHPLRRLIAFFHESRVICMEVINNIDKTLGADLKKTLGKKARLSIAAAYFSIYAS